ncbi:hypothetical protein MACJ_000726 [Theileria orientalis]|uniref:6-Cys domain-containing protein n=1 Tax=Theileria orientalis TaxID=68886 RepID=A0A976QPY9_THEOR|nr:hypothetical protein MACJ_000726 [Theileria orientalis]
MKLTTILYGIILCLAIENGKYYTLAAGEDSQTPPPVSNLLDESEDHPDGSHPSGEGLHGAPPLVPEVPKTSAGTTPVSSPASGDGKSTATTTSTGTTTVSSPASGDGKSTATTTSTGTTTVSSPASGDGKSTATTTSTGTTPVSSPASGDGKSTATTTSTGTTPVSSSSGDTVKPPASSSGTTVGPGGSASLSTGTTTTSSLVTPISSTGIDIVNLADPSKLKGNEKDKKIVKDGCNFYDKLDLGVKPFGEIKGDKTVCTVKLNEEFDAFLYACDGTSDPPRCPSEVKTEEGVVNIKTLFSQVTVTDESDKFVSKPNVSHVITGKANKPFSASCVCTKKDGIKETMELTSSFKQAGILGILGFLIVYLMK